MADGKLTALKVKNLSKPGTYADGRGLYLTVAPEKVKDGKKEPGSRSWLFRYKVAGKGHWLGLGGAGGVSLAQARIAAEDARRMVRAGVDPIAAKRTAKAQAAATEPAKTFETAADDYITAHKAGWKNEKHGKQWRATLEAYVFPLFGQNPVAGITVDDVLDCLTPIWEAKPETASRLRGRIEAVLDYAKTRGWRAGENPARWKGHLDHLGLVSK
jgi:hypothetical protein